MSRAKREAKKQLAVEAEKAKIQAKQAAKAERRAKRDQQVADYQAARARMSPEERSADNKRNLIIVTVLVALIGGCVLIANLADDDTDRAGDRTTPTATTRPARATRVTVPPMTDVALDVAHRTARNAGIDVEPVDLSPELLSSGHRRTIVRSSNWHVLIQRPTPGTTISSDEPVRVGVLKDDELTIADRVALATAELPNC